MLALNHRTVGPFFPYPTEASPAAIWALRRVLQSYVGPIVRISRSPDDAERDFYSVAGGQLNLAEITNFVNVGDGTGRVRTFYDQTGNGHHAVQPIPSSQAALVTGGTTFTTFNGRLIINCVSNQFYYTPTDPLGSNFGEPGGNTSDMTVVALTETVMGRGTDEFGTTPYGWSWQWHIQSTNAQFVVLVGVSPAAYTLTVTPTAGMVKRTYTLNQTPGVNSVAAYKENGVQLSTDTYGNWALRGMGTGFWFQIGRINTFPVNGRFAEAHVFTSVLNSAQEAQILQAMSAIYGV